MLQTAETISIKLTKCSLIRPYGFFFYAAENSLTRPQKRQIYDHHGEVRYHQSLFGHARVNHSTQEGLKAHEGGKGHHANPFDMFANFFGGRKRNPQPTDMRH